MDKPIPEAVRAWLDEWCEDHGVELPADAYNEMLESLTAAQQQGQAVAVVGPGGYPNWLLSWLESEAYRTLPQGTKLYAAPPSAPESPITATCRVCDSDYRCVPVPAKCADCGSALPPSAPVGVEGLPRYGFPNGDEPRPVPCADGYWTPWHLAQQPAAVDEAGGNDA